MFCEEAGEGGWGGRGLSEFSVVGLRFGRFVGGRGLWGGGGGRGATRSACEGVGRGKGWFPATERLKR